MKIYIPRKSARSALTLFDLSGRRPDHAREASQRVRRVARARASDRGARLREGPEGGQEPRRRELIGHIADPAVIEPANCKRCTIGKNDSFRCFINTEVQALYNGRRSSTPQ